MKAVVWTKYGSPDGMKLQEVDKPVPKENEILVKVRAASVTAGDCEIRRFKLPLGVAIPLRIYIGITAPRRITILGQELSGEVEAVGKDVTQFKEGDAIFASAGLGLGAYAQYRIFPEQRGILGVLAHKPANMSFEEAAVIVLGGFETLHFFNQANIQPGEKILINGAGGSIGTIAVQLAKSLGAEVTAVDSGDKLPMLTSIGADHTIDYTQEDFTKRTEMYDVIFDVIGRASVPRSAKRLNPNGRFMSANSRFIRDIQGRQISNTTDKKVIGGTSNYNIKDFQRLKELAEAGTIKAVIDRSYPLEQVPEAHRYVESNKKKGNVVITIPHEAQPHRS